MHRPAFSSATALAVALVLAATAGVAGQPSTDDVEDDALDRAIAILDRLERVTASVVYVDEPLADVIEDLNWFIDVPLTADWEALVPLGIDPDTEVTLRLEDAPLSTVLAAVALKLGNGFDRPRVEVFEAGMLVLTTAEATVGMQITDVYDVRDLLTDERAVAELRRMTPSRRAGGGAGVPEADEAPGATSGDGAEAEAEADTDDAPAGAASRPGWRLPTRGNEEPPSSRPDRPASRMSPAAELLTLIAEHVDPEAWIEFGGTRASIGERGGVLLVTATPTTHRAFRETLRRLRRVYASNVTIDASLVEIPRERYTELTRRHESSSAALGRAVVTAREARVLWRAASGITMEQPLVFESNDEAGEISITLTAHFDRATGSLTFDVGAETLHASQRSAVHTTVNIPPRHGGATIEMPGAGSSETVRLVVLIPTRG